MSALPVSLALATMSGAKVRGCEDQVCWCWRRLVRLLRDVLSLLLLIWHSQSTFCSIVLCMTKALCEAALCGSKRFYEMI